MAFLAAIPAALGTAGAAGAAAAGTAAAGTAAAGAGAAGAAAAGTAAAGAGAAGAAGAGAAGAAGAGAGAAGGLGSMLGGLFGGGGGAAGAAGGAAGGAASAGGGLQGLLSTLGGSGAGGGGGLEGLLSMFGGQSGGAAAPVQLAGPGVAEGAAVPAMSAGQAGAAPGGGGILDFLKPNGQDWTQTLSNVGRGYNQGAMAGRGDFRGAAQMQAQHANEVDRSKRTNVLEQGNTREGEKFALEKAKLQKTDAANSEIQKIFDDPKSFDNLSDTMTKVLPHMIAGGNHQGAHDVLGLLVQSQKDKQTARAMQTAGLILKGARQDDGSVDMAKFNDGIAQVGDPYVSKAAEGMMPSLNAELMQGRSGQGTAGMRDLIHLIKPGAKTLEELDDTGRNNIMLLRNAGAGEKSQLLKQLQAKPNAPLDINKAMSEGDSRKTNVTVNIAGQGAEARAAGTERGYEKVSEQRLARITREAEAVAGGKPLDPTTNSKVADGINFRHQIQNINDNFDESFLGPVKGTDAAFKARRQIGSYVNSPLGSQEVLMRQSLADAKDMLVRARTGMQMNKTEYDKIESMLPKATDEKQVFKAALGRVDDEMQQLIANRIRLGSTPRSQLNPDGGTKGKNQLGGASGGWSIRPK